MKDYLVSAGIKLVLQLGVDGGEGGQGVTNGVVDNLRDELLASATSDATKRNIAPAFEKFARYAIMCAPERGCGCWSGRRQDGGARWCP